jgi:hypothetical protein
VRKSELMLKLAESLATYGDGDVTVSYPELDEDGAPIAYTLATIDQVVVNDGMDVEILV